MYLVTFDLYSKDSVRLRVVTEECCSSNYSSPKCKKYRTNCKSGEEVEQPYPQHNTHAMSSYMTIQPALLISHILSHCATTILYHPGHSLAQHLAQHQGNPLIPEELTRDHWGRFGLQPRSLRHLCCLCVRHAVPDQRVLRNLDLPPLLRNILLHSFMQPVMDRFKERIKAIFCCTRSCSQ